MSWSGPQLPLPVRIMNGAVASLRGVGLPVLSLDPDSLMRGACQRTGLRDFGSDFFREPLQRLCAALEGEAELTAMGRMIARGELSRLLDNRLQFADIFKKHPEIGEQEVAQPVFILGMPRTGTTSTHELLALDPRLRVPLSWEAARPLPPPETASYHSDPRIEMADKELSQLDRLLPGFKNMHPMGAELPQECVALFCHDFASMQFDVEFRVPTYQRWLETADLAELYRNHRRWLQVLQWRHPGQPWVLKTPQHLWNLDLLLAEYPDARLVQLHRDPLKVIVSIASLIATLRSLGSVEVKLEEIALEYAGSLARGLEHSMQVRADQNLPSQRIIDIQFLDFIEDPVAAVSGIYDHFGLGRTEDCEARMRSFIDAARESERHGRHHYNFADTKLDINTQRARFARYQQHYQVAHETL